jgi:hypothetical protein
MNSPIHYLNYDAEKFCKFREGELVSQVFNAWRNVTPGFDSDLQTLLDHFRLR